jgi:hypothetical protein
MLRTNSTTISIPFFRVGVSADDFDLNHLLTVFGVI